MARSIHVRLDNVLWRALNEFAAEQDPAMTISEAARELMRLGLKIPADQRGRAEGYMAALAEQQKKIHS